MDEQIKGRKDEEINVEVDDDILRKMKMGMIRLRIKNMELVRRMIRMNISIIP